MREVARSGRRSALASALSTSLILAGAAAAFPVADGWAPQRFQHSLSASWVAVAPAGAFDLLVAVRKLNIPFYAGELARLSAFAEAAGAILAGLGDRPAFGALPPSTASALPPRAVTLAGRLPIA